jgi:hypothetical protein
MSKNKRGTALVMFEGVDEVPISQGDGAAGSYPRTALLCGLVEAVQGWATKGNRRLVTSRPYGLNEVERQKLGLPAASICCLTPDCFCHVPASVRRSTTFRSRSFWLPGGWPEEAS